MAQLLTTQEVADIIGQPTWLVRRAADAINPPVSKFGGKRAIPLERLDEITAEINRRTQRAQIQEPIPS